jgi:glycerol transport system ATP-binding protein
VIPAEVQGSVARVKGESIRLGHDYGPMQGRVVIGIRPEFARLTDGEGLPVTIRRIEDVGRHRIVRAEVMGHDVNIIAGEGERIGPEMTRVWFDPGHVNVYADDWRVEPRAKQGEAA